MTKYRSAILNQNPNLWNPEKTILDNSKAFGISITQARNIARLNNLQYFSKYFKKICNAKIVIPNSFVEEKAEDDRALFTWDNQSQVL